MTPYVRKHADSSGFAVFRRILAAGATLCLLASAPLSGSAAQAAAGLEGQCGPMVSADEWTLSSPEAEGIDAAALAAMVEAIESGQFTKIDSVIVARRGRLVFEAYFNGFEAETLHDTRSSFKSVTSILIGIAVDHGLIGDVRDPILPAFSQYETFENWSEDKRAITLEHLLTMTAGFDAEENFGVGPWREDDMWKSRDWIKFTLDLPMAHRPGEQFSYNTPTSVLLGGVLRQASGEPVPEFARKRLFEPLCILDYRWRFSPSGQAMTGGSFFIRPRDMAKFGQLFLDRGVWNGRRIVSQEWVDRSTRRRVAALPPGSQIPHELEEMGYGYHWWTHRRFLGSERTSTFLAAGNGGQVIYVFPGFDLVVVFTGSNYNDPKGHRQPRQIVRSFILPAVRD